MEMSAKTLRTQLHMLQPLLKNCSLETLRKGQNRIGDLMERRYRRQVQIREHCFDNFTGAWIIPEDQRRQGVVLYLHGGGYTCGSLEYAKGFGSALAALCGVRVFCGAYRLAPEHPYPAALEDALECYRYLLSKGYAPEKVALCGESAGGGLCYSLCLKLKELGIPGPCGIIAVSPWTDLTASGPSYEENREKDPSLTKEQLEFCADCYARDREDPLVSPLFGEMAGMPPSLMFAGEDELLRSDSQRLHEKLQAAGRKSQLVVTKDRWHAYLLYGLAEDKKDIAAINRFLSTYLSPERKLRWMRLDNAAKIYPAARRQNWSNMFRLSVTLTEEVDAKVLQQALDVTVRRFPSIAARLRRGVFWYYLQHLSQVPKLHPESSYPLTRMSREEMRQCAFRVLVYGKRIAVEFFHSLTDGSGGLVFLKTLTAEYLQEKYGLSIPTEQGILGRLEEPSPAELEDSFQKYCGSVSDRGKEKNAWHPFGTPEPDGFLHLTCLQVPVKDALETAHRYGVSLTSFLGAVMIQALQRLQQQSVADPTRRKPIRVLIPINLRNLFPSKTLRNFALYTTPEIDPRLGQYSFPELCRIVHYQIGLEAEPKLMSAKIAANVGPERNLLVRIMPLFVKNLAMKVAFHAVGERKSCLSLSNLGRVTVPEEMAAYVARMDFILGIQATAPNNCGVITYGDTVYVNFIRNIREPDLEYHFACVLRDLGLSVLAQSNQSGKE